MYRYTIQRNLLAHGVAGGAGDVGNNRHFVARQRVEQAGLADIGRAHQHHRHAFAQQAALPRRRAHGFHLPLQRRQPAAGVGGFEKINVFFRKIERGFHQHPQRNQFVHQRVNVPRKLAFERAQRHFGGALAGSVDQIGDAFGLRQIEFVVEKRAFGELARLGGARAQLKTARQQHLHHHRPAVPLQFDNVFAGKAGRRGEIQQQAVVDRRAVGSGKIGIERRTRLGRFAAADGLCQRQKVFAGNADDADAAAPGGGGNSGDGLGRIRHEQPEKIRVNKSGLSSLKTTNPVFRLLFGVLRFRLPLHRGQPENPYT